MQLLTSDLHFDVELDMVMQSKDQKSENQNSQEVFELL